MEEEAIREIGALRYIEEFNWTAVEGKLNTTNSPRYFPGLDLTGRRFLHGVATAMHLSRISLLLCSERLHDSYFSTDIELLTTVTDELVLVKDIDPLLLLPKYDFRSLRLYTLHEYDRLSDITPDGITAVEMHFAPTDNHGGNKEVSITLQSNPLRKYRGYDYLNGLTKDDARDLLGRKVTPDKAAEVIGTYSDTPMALTIRSPQAELKIVFAGEGTRNTKIDYVNCQLSVTNSALTEDLIKVQLPVSDFSKKTMFASQYELEVWLSKIALNLAKRVKPSQGVRMSLNQSRPIQTLAICSLK